MDKEVRLPNERKKYVSIFEENDWNQSKAKDFNIYPKPNVSRAEELLEDSDYMTKSKGIIDNFSYQLLSRTERKKLKEQLCEISRKKPVHKPIKRSDHPVVICPTVKTAGSGSEPTPNDHLIQLIKKKTQNLKHNSLEKRMFASIYAKKLHSIEYPVDYESLVERDADCGQQNLNSDLAIAVRTVCVIKREKQTDDLSADTPLRQPKTCVFSTGLRRPKPPPPAVKLEAIEPPDDVKLKFADRILAKLEERAQQIRNNNNN